MARRRRAIVQYGSGIGSVFAKIPFLAGKAIIKSAPKLAMRAGKRIARRLPKMGMRAAKRGVKRLSKRAPKMAMNFARTKGKRFMRRLPGMAMRFAKKKSTRKIGKKLFKVGMRMLMNKIMPGQGSASQPQQQQISYDQNNQDYDDQGY